MQSYVEHVVHEYHAHNSTSGVLIAGLGIVGTRASPACENNRHANKGSQILGSASEVLRCESKRDSGDEVPAGQAQIDPIDRSWVCNADSVQNFGKEVSTHAVRGQALIPSITCDSRDEAVSGPLCSVSDPHTQ